VERRGPFLSTQGQEVCLINTKWKSNGAVVRSFWKQARLLARLMARCLPLTARPSGSRHCCFDAKAAEARPQDFFPLTVNYQEKTYAAGKIPGGYFKREGRPSENETLVSRLIDRPIRPLFAAWLQE
jgi:hypothetical protein